ncbi:MT-A70-domain-containing protein [Dunaliella salina]|uniref:MT-A70-domain-containing protein n=1 Tax=Dunaliella salina TaxID=3046 RepID=A0ABQ7GR20_DUNSA|nr:MT-A70-domain-containing protein [Dunaliella salina]|eukprot:KAF5837050.1 MT-A70-domain-containing protein [Dunaliella salina]
MRSCSQARGLDFAAAFNHGLCPGLMRGPGSDLDVQLPSIMGRGGGPAADDGNVKLEGGGHKRGREEMDGDIDLGTLLNYKSAAKWVLEGVYLHQGRVPVVLSAPSAREKATLDYFKSNGAPAITEHCPHLTREECFRRHEGPEPCKKLHFRRIIHPWTDERLGNCSYLNTCRNIRNCKYIHYEVDPDPVPDAAYMFGLPPNMMGSKNQQPVPKYLQALPEPQWLQCDIRTLDMPVLGKFGVIMADPPWQIHQDLPYGTMEDDEMRNMNIGCLQDHGVIFLWVTGRAMELARECLKIWGYDRVDELIWVKTNQLQRLIRTGRTGHWLNHSKEHCLIGVKGKPALNRFVDCDVLVSEVRETSRKPDEMYSLLERLSPGTRKLEIFARSHNLKPGWVGLGNQLDGVQILEPEMRARYEARYGRAGPDGRLPLNFQAK